MAVVLFGVPEMSFKKLGTMVHIIFEGYNSSSFWLLPTSMYRGSGAGSKRTS